MVQRREVKHQRGLDPGSPSWPVGSTHGSRPSGQQAHCLCLLSERKKTTWGGSRQTLSVWCLSSNIFPHSQTAPEAGVRMFHQLHLCPPWNKWDVCKQNSGLLPALVLGPLQTLLPRGGAVTCITATPASDLGDAVDLYIQCLGKNFLLSFTSHSTNPGAGQACNERSFSSGSRLITPPFAQPLCCLEAPYVLTIAGGWPVRNEVSAGLHG